MANVYVQGQSVKLSVTYLGASGQPTDPNNPTVRVRRPDGVVEELTFMAGALAREDAGQYIVWVETPQYGRYLWRGTGTSPDGTATPVHQGYFDVTQGF